MKREDIKIAVSDHAGSSKWDSAFSVSKADEVIAFHRSIPGYEETPLVSLDALAEEIGVAKINIKDESFRFGLNAFKGLGGSYCIASYIAKELGIDMKDVDYDLLTSPETHEKIKDLTFVTTTDGNHGRGIAWTAKMLGVKAKVFMPKVSTRERLENIRALGADAEITEYNYDDAVRYAKDHAEKNGWPLVQDTAWEGYEDIPLSIMQGYMTMISEAVSQLDEPPTHVFLQAGVGAMSGAVTGFLANYYGEEKPVITIVEPDKADCIYQTAHAGDGKLRFVTGDMDTIMAGLSCGKPCTIGWALLDAHAEYFISMPDNIAAKGMRVLACPLESDRKIVSGESGAAPFGFVCEVLENPEMKDLKETIGLGPDSRILCISTEGDTDKASYRRIVWDGEYPSV